VVVREPAAGLWEIRVSAPLIPLGPQGYAIHVSGRVAVPEVATWGPVEPEGGGENGVGADENGVDASGGDGRGGGEGYAEGIDEAVGEAAFAQNGSTAPANFAFHAPRPNPFTGSTSLELALPSPSDVTLTIFDVTGRAVVTLADGRLPAGDHRFVWNGRDGGDRRVAPGAYFARAVAGGVIETRKVVIASGR
jgi:hypothetical protein